MEVFIAIILLFGAFSLGSATHHDADDDHSGLELTVTANKRQEQPGESVESANVEHVQSPGCLADRHFVIYRDLSVAYQKKHEIDAVPVDVSEKAYPHE